MSKCEFIVSESGELSLGGYGEPRTRFEAYNLSSDNFLTADGIIFEAETHQPVLWELQSLFQEWRKAEIEKLSTKGGDEDSLEEFQNKWDDGFLDDVNNVSYWLGYLTQEQLSDISDRMLLWCSEDPACDDGDYISEPMCGQDMAYQMFSEGYYSDQSEELGVELVEGDSPFSTYLAAVLSIPVDQANKRAEKLELDLRFKKEPVLLYESSDNFTMLSSWTEKLYCQIEDDGSLSLQEHKQGDGGEDWFDPIENIRTVEDLEEAINGLYNIDFPSIDDDFISNLKKIRPDLAAKLNEKHK